MTVAGEIVQGGWGGPSCHHPIPSVAHRGPGSFPYCVLGSLPPHAGHTSSLEQSPSLCDSISLIQPHFPYLTRPRPSWKCSRKPAYSSPSTEKDPVSRKGVWAAVASLWVGSFHKNNGLGVGGPGIQEGVAVTTRPRVHSGPPSVPKSQ